MYKDGFSLPALSEKIQFSYMLEGFEDYMNSLFRGYGLPEPFVANREFVNPFTSDKTDQITKRKAERIIRGSIRLHKRYLRKTKVRRLIRGQTFS